MNDIKLLKSLFDKIDYPCYVQFVETVWTFDSEHVIFYNTDDDQEDLENQDGETYSVDLREGWIKHDGYLVVNCGDGCGNTITHFFKLEKEI